MSSLPVPFADSLVRRVPALAAGALSLILAACAAGTSPQPIAPANATGSLAPAATATVAPSPSIAPSPAFPVTLTGDDGESITLAKKPTKIVSLTPAETEILYQLGAGDRLVGKVEDVANFPPESSSLPVVGTFSGVDVEKIVGLGTDLVIAGANGGTQPEAVDKLRSLKVPVLAVYAADVEGVYKDIELTGDAVGEPDGADALVTSIRDQFRQVADATAGATKPRVFYETGDQPSIFGIADQSVYAQMISLAGGTPITTGSATAWDMPVEKLVQADPQLIILGDWAYGVTASAVAKRPGWAGLTAVKNKAIVGIDDIVVTRPGPRLGNGLFLLAQAIHPELHLGPAASAGASTAPAASASASAYGG
ncbi:MAG TPA: ABC transporter substrate-binding protein [Candidatus Limnocylindrales bacterium]|nr:ABC transporter substrate-binding protein [Candidatus Limnocylindrales bacterium]